ncbi:ML domain-containing protein [Actinosynnema sp. NPDC020468]|uniref:ML domain-containing protein n=1 Tax=Actinosynnema sp. NPDC020468 TaxID=3154488 RepID=UPI0033EF9D3D
MRRTLAALTAAVAALAPTTPAHALPGWSYEDCATAGHDFALHTVGLTPDPPAAGQGFTVRLAGTVVRTIESGALAHVSIDVGDLTVISRTYDLGQELAQTDPSLRLPLTPGFYTIPFDFPGSLPKQVFRIRIRVDNADEHHAACVDLSLDLR